MLPINKVVPIDVPCYKEWSKKILYPKIKEKIQDIDDYLIVFPDDDYNTN